MLLASSSSSAIALSSLGALFRLAGSITFAEYSLPLFLDRLTGSIHPHSSIHVAWIDGFWWWWWWWCRCGFFPFLLWKIPHQNDGMECKRDWEEKRTARNDWPPSWMRRKGGILGFFGAVLNSLFLSGPVLLVHQKRRLHHCILCRIYNFILDSWILVGWIE